MILHFAAMDLHFVLIMRLHSPPIGSGTVIAFQPDFLHGTTLTSNAINKGIAICFSRCVSKAWEEAKKTDRGASVIAAAGADREVE